MQIMHHGGWAALVCELRGTMIWAVIASGGELEVTYTLFTHARLSQRAASSDFDLEWIDLFVQMTGQMTGSKGVAGLD